MLDILQTEEAIFEPNVNIPFIDDDLSIGISLFKSRLKIGIISDDNRLLIYIFQLRYFRPYWFH